MTCGLIGIAAVVVMTILACLWFEYFTKYVQTEAAYDEYEAEQARLSWEANKEYGIKQNKLTAINAVKEK